ncbi:MAG: hypothetical protein ACE5J2_06505 [Nitrososphaerales archaeon]
MEPLRKVEDAKFTKLIPQGVYKKISKRFSFVREGIKRVEKASGIKYPSYYVEPSIMLSTSPIETGHFGILFARTIPVVSHNRLNIRVQLTGPLIAFGIMGTIHAILAHEFLHYLELVGRMVKMNIVSDELSGTLFEATYRDQTRLFDPRAVFNKDKSIIGLITKKFPEGFHDSKLERKCIKLWLNKGLPTTRIRMDENVIRIPISVVASTPIDKNLKKKIYELEVTQEQRRKKRHQ